MNWTRARDIAIGAGIETAGKIAGVVIVLWASVAFIVGSIDLAVWIAEAVRS